MATTPSTIGPVRIDTPGLYIITVQGMLDPERSQRLAGMQVTPAGDLTDGISQLTGWLSDQAALHGVLSTLHALSLPILTVNRVM